MLERKVPIQPGRATLRDSRCPQEVSLTVAQVDRYTGGRFIISINIPSDPIIEPILCFTYTPLRSKRSEVL